MAVLSRTLIWCCSSLERRLLAQCTSCTRSERKSWSWFCLNVHKALIWTALLGPSLLTLPLSVCVTYCTSILLSSIVSAFTAEVLRWNEGLFFIIVSLLLLRLALLALGVHSWTFGVKGVSNCSVLWKPRCMSDASLRPFNVSLWSRLRETHLSLWPVFISPEALTPLFYCLPSVPAHTALRKKVCSVPFFCIVFSNRRGLY